MNKIKGTILTLAFPLISLSSFSQNKLTGCVHDNDGNIMKFVSLCLFSIGDSSAIYMGTISDMFGNFQFSPVKKGEFILKVNSIGFNPLKIPLSFQGNDTNLQINLKPKIYELGEVNISQNSVKNSASGTSFIITTKETAQYNSGFQLLNIIPDINTDEINRKIVTRSGGDVKLLLNGISSDEKEILGLRSKDIVKIEYYNIPPARFSAGNYSAVINFIAKKRIDGYGLNLNFQNAVLTGFYNDLVSLYYNKRNFQFKVQYDLEWRNYKKMYVNENLSYSAKDTNYNIIRVGRPGSLMYRQNNISINLNWNCDSNRIFNLRIYPDHYYGKNKKNQDFSSSKNDFKDSGYNETKDFSSSFNPGADLYFYNGFWNKSEIVVNCVLNYFESDYENYKNETSFTTGKNQKDSSLIYGAKGSAITEAIWSKEYKKFNLNVGIQNSYFNSDLNDQIGLSKKKAKTSSDESYIYSEISGKYKGFSCLINSGLMTNFITGTGVKEYFFSAFRGTLAIDYNLTEFSSLRFDLSFKPITPSITELSNVRIYKDEHLFLAGNPNLKPYKSKETRLNYSLNKSSFKFSGDLSYNDSKKTILPYFFYNGNDIIQTFDNMASSCEYSTSGYIDISPFKKNWMDLILYGKSYFEENLMTNNTKKQLSGNNYAAVVSFLYKNWSFRYAIQTKAFHLSGDFRKFDQNTAIISLNYGTSTLSIGGELYFAFQNGSRYGYSVDSKIFKSDYSSEIFDNGNMFVLNISYNFSHGHVPSIFQRKIQNNDQDSGILKPD